MFEVIEQEKEIMEEEYGNALNLNEELMDQLDLAQRVICNKCQVLKVKNPA